MPHIAVVEPVAVISAIEVHATAYYDRREEDLTIYTTGED